MDYRKYRAGFVEKLACAAVGAGAAGMAAWLFYRSVWGMLLFPAAYLVCVKKYCALQKEKRKEQLLMEFKDAMQSASAALLAGYSVENAWRETEKELLELQSSRRRAHCFRAGPPKRAVSRAPSRSVCGRKRAFRRRT